VVCVWPEDIKYLNPAVDMAQRIHDASPEYGFRLPGTVYERGVGPRPDEGFMVNAGRWMIADWLGAKAVVDTVPLCGSDDEIAQLLHGAGESRCLRHGRRFRRWTASRYPLHLRDSRAPWCR
jgi:hypothetical protein